jgi:hypothetical protein
MSSLVKVFYDTIGVNVWISLDLSILLKVLRYENGYNIFEKSYELFIYGDRHYITNSFVSMC